MEKLSRQVNVRPVEGEQLLFVDKHLRQGYNSRAYERNGQK